MSAYLSREPISVDALIAQAAAPECGGTCLFLGTVRNGPDESGVAAIEYTAYDDMARSEEHTSELQSPCNLVCRLLLEKKKKKKNNKHSTYTIKLQMSTNNTGCWKILRSIETL